MLSLLLMATAPAHAGDFVDVWVTTAVEDDNVRAGPAGDSPTANFVTRGNNTFFEQYESRTSDDITRGNLVLYRKDDSFFEGWWTEAAFVMRFTPFLDPDETDPGVDIADDGSYVRVVRDLSGDDHNLSLTGYAVDAGRFKLGYSYDLSWGGRDIFVFDSGASPGARLQWQKGDSYVFAGAKTAIGNYRDPELEDFRNQAFWGSLTGAGIEVADKLRLEAGAGSFQQGQFLNVDDTNSARFGETIQALGLCGQIALRSTSELEFIQSADLKLYRNAPDSMRDTYISHRQLDGFGVLVQAEVNRLSHNLLDSEVDDATVIETGIAADLQTVFVAQNTSFGADLVYKDLEYIVFNVPGLTSNFAMPDSLERTPQVYGRGWVAHYIPDAHMQPYIGGGLMRPATYTNEGSIFVQKDARNKEAVPDGQEASAILSVVGGTQLDLSKSVVFVGEVLYTVDNNKSDFVQASDDDLTGERVSAPENERKALGFNLMMRARF
jgi:hypothetical protein